MKPILPSGFRHVLWMVILAPSFAIWGCLSGSEGRSQFEGQWRGSEPFVFTLRDSLYQVELKRYADGLGYYLPFDPELYEEPTPGKTRMPDSLWLAFRYDCTRADCDSVLHTTLYYLRFENDSLKHIDLKNGEVEYFNTNKFRVDRDSIYENIEFDIEIASSYLLYANGDSLEIGQWGYPEYFGRNRDVLPPH